MSQVATMNNEMKFYVVTAKGLEETVEVELKRLGIGNYQKEKSGFEVIGTLKDAYRLCLELRCANRVLLPLKKFDASTPEKLYGGVKSIRWGEHVEATGTIAVEVNTTHSQITHTQFAAQKAKDAIVDQLRSIYGVRPSVEKRSPDIRINIHIQNDVAQVAIDLSGDSLHRRGYRIASTLAPLKENLAAGIMTRTGWYEKICNGEENLVLIDPMCGSGTLLFEASLMALDKAPGLDRKYFGFLGWKKHDKKIWKECTDEAILRETEREKKFEENKKLRPQIIGYDASSSAIHTALKNRENADLSEWIHFEKKQFEDLIPPAEKGILVLNPPYGERLGVHELSRKKIEVPAFRSSRTIKPAGSDVDPPEEEVFQFYKKIGDCLKKNWKNWDVFLFSGNLQAIKHIGLKPTRKWVFWNGAIESRLVHYELYEGTLRKDFPKKAQ